MVGISVSGVLWSLFLVVMVVDLYVLLLPLVLVIHSFMGSPPGSLMGAYFLSGQLPYAGPGVSQSTNQSVRSVSQTVLLTAIGPLKGGFLNWIQHIYTKTHLSRFSICLSVAMNYVCVYGPS